MVKVKPVQNGRTTRMSFSRINEVIGMPNLIEIQKNSYNWFLEEGLHEVFHDIAAIEDYTGNLVLEFVDYRLDKNPKYSIKECKERDATYAAPLYVTARLFNKQTGEVKEQLGWGRKKATVLVGVIMVALGTLSSLGYGPLAGVTVIGMQFLDFFDFLTNSVMMPIAAIATCLLVSRVIGVDKIEQEVELDGRPFRRKRIFRFMIRWLCPVFAAVILASSVANAFGIIKM